MEECEHHRRHRRKKGWLICVCVTIAIIILLLILYFAAYKPKDPSVQMPYISMTSYNVGTTAPSFSAITFGLNLQVSIYNPNKGDFQLENTSTASLQYGAAWVGASLFPSSNVIPSQSAISLAVHVDLQRPLTVNLTATDTNVGNYLPLPISSLVNVIGHSTSVGMFSIHSNVLLLCNIDVGLGKATASIISFACGKSYSA
ncbi:hypothetical protein KP509_03G013700 [Ceratopteris richardii]|uniref:Late embryogenesis abundant protein LEA-2 subgroup domain-containing protein n=1 Tax=Ceratopteris richardii TaxID=49495 RepID=A0A8T2V4M5_CERRI|nr:hypothetical protein KP509_03G013700 [Ceratopteris richardii]